MLYVDMADMAVQDMTSVSCTPQLTRGMSGAGSDMPSAADSMSKNSMTKNSSSSMPEGSSKLPWLGTRHVLVFMGRYLIGTLRAAAAACQKTAASCRAWARDMFSSLWVGAL